MTWIQIGHIDELEENDFKLIEVEGELLALYRLSDGYYVTSGMCTHQNKSLARGWVQKGLITCARHGGQFDIKTGEAVRFPCIVSLKTYRTDVRGNEIWVESSNRRDRSGAC